MAHPVTREVFCACSNNTERGTAGFEGANPANRRAPNRFGHIVRWRERRRRSRGHALPVGRMGRGRAAAHGGTIKGDEFACPDGLSIDTLGALWVQTDVSPRSLGRRRLRALGNNQMLAVDPSTGAFRRF